MYGISSKKATIQTCTNKANIKGNSSHVGGIVGQGLPDGYCEIKDCYNSNVTPPTNSYNVVGTYLVGGIVGWLGGNSTINLVRNDGTVYASGHSPDEYKNSFAGGIVGAIDSGTYPGDVEVSYAYSKGAVTGGYNTNGGIAGMLQGSSSKILKGSYLYSEAPVSTVNSGSNIGAICGWAAYTDMKSAKYSVSSLSDPGGCGAGLTGDTNTGYFSNMNVPSTLTSLKR